ncbi:MAG TPA: hypothetical protein VKT82_19685 [Ktedonobacterales bacterium]|nr:hypothetical protein [Ktedonobacterales bacterium]
MRSIIARYPGGQRLAARNGLFRGVLSALLSSSFALILMMTCQQSTYIAPASANVLSILLTISNQYTTNDKYVPGGMVQISLSIEKGGRESTLEGTSLACNGTAFQWDIYDFGAAITLPRQPAGNAYHCVYTDEQGKKTSFLVPIPPGTLAITSPTPGDTVHLAGGPSSPPANTPTPGPRPPALVSTVPIRYTLPTLPAGASGRLEFEAICGKSHCPSQWGHQSIGANSPATGTCAITDADLAYGSGFETFPSASSGTIQLTSTFSWSVPVSKLLGLRVEYTDMLSIPVIWSR